MTWLGLLTIGVQFSTAARELIVRTLKLCQRIKNKKGSGKWGRIVSFWQNRLPSSGQVEIFIYSYLCVHLYMCMCVWRQNSWRNWNVAEISVRIAMHFANKITYFPFTPAVTFPAVTWKQDDFEKQEGWCWIQPWLSKSRIMLSNYREWVQIYTQGLRTESSLKHLFPTNSVSCCFPQAAHSIFCQAGKGRRVLQTHARKATTAVKTWKEFILKISLPHCPNPTSTQTLQNHN